MALDLHINVYVRQHDRYKPNSIVSKRCCLPQLDDVEGPESLLLVKGREHLGLVMLILFEMLYVESHARTSNVYLEWYVKLLDSLQMTCNILWLYQHQGSRYITLYGMTMILGSEFMNYLRDSF